MKLIFGILFATACATPKIPFSSERELYEPSWGMGITKAVTVHNPFDYDVVAVVVCRHDLFDETGRTVLVPAHGQKQMLVNLNKHVIGEACHVSNFDFLSEEE